MSGDRGDGLRTLATLGLAVCGPAALFTGLLTFVTIPSGVPLPLVVVFLLASGGTGLFVLIYLADEARRRG